MVPLSKRKEQNLHRGNEDLVLLMRLLLSLKSEVFKIEIGKECYPHWQQLPTGAQLPGLAWVSALLWSRRRTSERRCIRPAHPAVRTQSPCSSWSPQHASVHRPQMPTEPPFRLSLAFKANRLQDFACMIGFIWSPLLAVLTKVLGSYKPSSEICLCLSNSVVFLYLCLISLSLPLPLCLSVSCLFLSLYISLSVQKFPNMK